MDQTFFPLDNTVQRADWGSTSVIQGLLGEPPDGRPAAELWLGAHPLAPSVASTPLGAVSLVDLVRADPVGMLGRRVQDTYGPRLPYLLKVLAADRALSLQVHPKPHLARAGFNRENAAGVPLTASHRNYKDDQSKPEMIVALGRFEGLAGFRRPDRSLALLHGLDGDLVAAMRDALAGGGRGPRPLVGTSASVVRDAFERAVHARRDERVADDVATTLASVRARAGTVPGWMALADAAALRLGADYPGDPGALAAFLLNVFVLHAGEAVFLAPGQVHAYLRGAGVEIMSSSDNVLRAGLTHKHVDVDALLECADFAPSPPPHPQQSAVASGLTSYRVPVREFGLVVGEVHGEPADLPSDGPRVVLVLDGVVDVVAGVHRTRLGRGASVFVPDAAGPLAVEPVSVVGATGVRGRVAVAYVP
ncbi:mannose-6-phosphate isomerase, class I [Luteimicrobium subarcticum]|uniref:mannose-6-phosphate isomerase n=1 Tax=Luteimicrobium subarcticum TaxID=620910 RepID=A0A2M8WSW7_9MICO|nr:mannose-6-phosphate isomerase, class I [Luteimicrobium subarcticum]PJI94010.1 mannose-6-phosphate isomerase type 1 [Luteimicrobium subarcticum]